MMDWGVASAKFEVVNARGDPGQGSILLVVLRRKCRIYRA
jgi:hypothetical protein